MTLYEYLVNNGIYEIDHHESDLYVPATSKVDSLLREWEYKYGKSLKLTKETFRDSITATKWYDIAFAYDPIWRWRRDMARFEEERQEARAEAVAWSTAFPDDTSYGEIFEKQKYFIDLARDYGLTREFHENGII